MTSSRRQPLLFAALLASTALATGSPAHAGDMQVGTNIHPAEPGYPDARTILKALDYLGVRQVRTGVPSKPKGINGDLANAGIKLEVVASGKLPIETTVARIVAFQTAHPGAIALVDGPNEVNNAPLTFQGLRDKATHFAPPLQYNAHFAASLAYMEALHAAMRGNPVTRDMPLGCLVGLSRYESDVCDIADQHLYARSAATVRGAMAKAINVEVGGIAASELPKPGKPRAGFPPFAPRHPGLPMMLSEVGFTVVGARTEAQQAIDLRAALDAAQAFGVQRFMVYQLFDGWADGNPAKPNGENHFGLFHNDGTPKPAAIALRDWVATH